MSPIDQPLVKAVCQRFCPLGAISAKTMFGGVGLYQAGIMFALIAEEKLYLRGYKALEALNLEAFIYTKRGQPIVLRYYHIKIDKDFWSQEIFLNYAQQALECARQAKQCKTETRRQRLKDLPNLGLSSERLLRRVGINSIEALQHLGAVNAYLRIKAFTCRRNLSLNYLWSLAGALTGCHAANLPKGLRQSLLTSLHSQQQCNHAITNQ
ncbi:MAG: TfoX/Sxy family DNA transformation protein [Candidatus Symbiodolus clandestinus]